jgi:methanogenic corrinoid protein MtbC1
VNGELRTDLGKPMTSFPSALKSVLSAGAGASFHAPPHFPTFPKAWPIFKLVTPTRVDLPESILAKIVASEIVPRLMLAHSRAPAAEFPSESQSVDPEPAGGAVIDVETRDAFARTILARSAEALTGFVADLLANGVSLASVYQDLLAPAAQRLADLWGDDELSYTEATIAFGRLQQLVRGLDRRTPYNGDNAASPMSALFSPRPGEQQTFGFYMMEEMFRWSGWKSWVETCATNAVLAAAAQRHWFDMMCLNVTRANELDEVAETIDSIRRASRNEGMFVVVNGGPFLDHPELVAAVGADASASDSRGALEIVDKAVSRRASQ